MICFIAAVDGAPVDQPLVDQPADQSAYQPPVDGAPVDQPQDSPWRPVISQNDDGSFIIPAELLDIIGNGGMLDLDIVHGVDCLPEEMEINEHFSLSEVMSQSSDNENNAQVEADVDVQHGRRKRKRNPQKWAKNIRKNKAHRGESFTSVQGHDVAARAPKSRTCCCQPERGYKCSEFSEAERAQLCAEYWHLSEYSRKKDWLLKHVIEVPVGRRRVDVEQTACKGRSLRWFLPKIEGNRLRVCKKFFTDTLDIGKSATAVLTAIENKSPFGTFSGQDNRGKHTPWNKTPQVKIDLVHEHIGTIPKMAAHYCRKDSNRQYIDPQLTIPRLYELYLSWLKEKSAASGASSDDVLKNPVSERRYREIFVNDFNISPFHPKKDQCVLCESWKNLSAAEKESRAEEKREHEQNKEDTKNFKADVKSQCKQDPTHCMATFDLEAILQLPCGQVSQLYYKRKLVVYNFTVYENPSSMGNCYLWTEVDGRKGSDEIGTCLLKYFQEIPDSISKVDIFSDNCGGQNKNIQIVAACLYAVNTIDHLKEIQHTFLETGHTQMECDSMHSAIEHAKKHVKIHSIGQWEEILSMARRKNPYRVTRMQYSDFYDFKGLVRATVQNKSLDEAGQTVNWRKVRSLNFKSCSESTVAYRYSLQDEYSQIDLSRGRATRATFPTTAAASTRKSARKKSRLVEPSAETSGSAIALQQKYKGLLPISKAKKKDLMDLCRSRVIDADYHAWYEALPEASDLVDKLPLPDIAEESSTED